jgi:hypothetical protein
MDNFCPKCGASLSSEANYCTNCGNAVGSIASNESNMTLIVVMWVLQFVAIVAVSVKVIGLGFVCGFLSFGIAIYLVTRKSYADRVNGWLRLAISLIDVMIMISHIPRR